MFCIIALPRTASTATWNFITTSLFVSESSYIKRRNEEQEPYNPLYQLTALEEDDMFTRLCAREPLPVVKILSNHTYRVALKYIDSSSGYKTVFIYPEDVRANVLKRLLMWKTKEYFGNRKAERKKLIGTIEFSLSDMRLMVEQHKEHMSLKSLCDYSFSDAEIISDPNKFLAKLGLVSLSPHHFKYIPPFYDDRILLINQEQFDANLEVALSEIV